MDVYPQNLLGPLTLGDGPEKSILARQVLLATLPIPDDIPDDALKPILIPPPFTLHEFLGNASGVSIIYFSPSKFVHVQCRP